MFERFTKIARAVVREAHEEARRRQHRAVNVEHLFWALLRQRNGIAPAVLDRLGLQRGALIESVEGVLAGGGAANPVAEIPFSPAALRALERSIQHARDLESNWVGTEHLLLGLLQDGQSPVARILDAHGVRFDVALAEVNRRHPSPRD